MCSRTVEERDAALRVGLQAHLGRSLLPEHLACEPHVASPQPGPAHRVALLLRLLVHRPAAEGVAQQQRLLDAARRGRRHRRHRLARTRLGRGGGPLLRGLGTPLPQCVAHVLRHEGRRGLLRRQQHALPTEHTGRGGSGAKEGGRGGRGGRR